MNGKWLLLGSFLAFPAFGGALKAASRDKQVVQEAFRIDLEEVSNEVRCQKNELELLNDKILTFQRSLELLKEETSQSGKATTEIEKEKRFSLEKKLALLEKNHTTLITDLKTLKDHLNDVQATLEKRLGEIDTKVSSDIKTLKSSLQSMLALLQGGKEPSDHCYVVQPGDSLGKIAQDHHISLKELKQYNQLNSDQIRVGQKIEIPKK